LQRNSAPLLPPLLMRWATFAFASKEKVRPRHKLRCLLPSAAAARHRPTNFLPEAHLLFLLPLRLLPLRCVVKSKGA